MADQNLSYRELDPFHHVCPHTRLWTALPDKAEQEYRQKKEETYRQQSRHLKQAIEYLQDLQEDRRPPTPPTADLITISDILTQATTILNRKIEEDQEGQTAHP